MQPIAVDQPGVTGESYNTEPVGTAWEGILVVEGVDTGDGRTFDLNAITWPDTQQVVIPLRRNIEDSHGGEARTVAVLVGRITQIWRDPSNPAMIRGAGVFDDNGANGAEALRLVRDGFLRGISVDPDDIANSDIELEFPPGSEDDPLAMPERMIFHAGRLRAATLVDIPAFVEAQIWLSTSDATAQQAVIAAAHFTPLISRAPWDPAAAETRMTPSFTNIFAAYAHAAPTVAGARLIHHEVDEEGNVGPANLTACAAGIRMLSSGRIFGLSVEQRHAAYEHLAAHIRAAGLTPAVYTQPEPLISAAEALEGPPLEWFTTVEPSDHYMAPTVTDEVTASGWRRFMGHGATWGTCHTGYKGVCRQTPHEGEHAYFRTGEVVCASGERVAVGSVTLGIGHASTRGISPFQAAEHYDNTSAVVALVASSEGEHGIWLAGAIPPWVTAERVAALQASGQLSGDWRPIGGQLRLIAFLAVNHGGFPVPRLTVGIQRGQQVSLIAAGMRTGDANVPDGRDVLEFIARKIGRDGPSRAAELHRRVKGQ